MLGEGDRGRRMGRDLSTQARFSVGGNTDVGRGRRMGRDLSTQARFSVGGNTDVGRGRRMARALSTQSRFCVRRSPMVREGVVSRENHPPGLYLLFEATQMLGEAGKTNNPSIRAKNR